MKAITRVDGYPHVDHCLVSYCSAQLDYWKIAAHFKKFHPSIWAMLKEYDYTGGPLQNRTKSCFQR